MGRAISDNGTHISIALLAREWDGLYQTMELTLASLCSPENGTGYIRQWNSHWHRSARQGMGRAISDNGTHISIALLAREAGILEHLENLRHGQRATLVFVCLVEGHVQLLELLIQPLIISSRHPGYLKINYTRKKKGRTKNIRGVECNN